MMKEAMDIIQYNRWMNEQQISPLSESQLQVLQLQKSAVDRDIWENNQELRVLNGKIVKNDMEHKQLNRLQERERILMTKRNELEDILRNQDLLQQEINRSKAQESNFKHNLGNEYKQIVEQRRKKDDFQKRQQIEEERAMHQTTKRLMEHDYLRKRQQMGDQRKSIQQQLALRENNRLREREEREREKEEYNRKIAIRNQLETQKDSVYKQYYSHFMDGQNRLQQIYSSKAGVYQQEKQMTRTELEKKEQEQFQNRLLRDQEEKVLRMNQDKDTLKEFLMKQMEEKTRKKSMEKEEELSYQNQVQRYQVNARESDNYERMRRKEDQKKYDEELKGQTRQKAYSNRQSQEGLYRQQHNPITNPIDFKIGITNPYIIKEYENTKERHMGDPSQLKLRGLAQLGNSFLGNHSHLVPQLQP